MIKNSLKNFFSNLLYVFIPMGIVYLFVLLAVFMFLGTAVQSFAGSLGDLVELVGTSVEQSSASVEDALAYSFGQIEWNGSLLSVLRQVLDVNWLQSTLVNFFETLNVSTAGFEAEFTAIVSDLKSTLLAQLGGAIALGAAGITIASYVTRFALRRKVAKRNVKKFVIAHTLAPLFEAVCVIAFLFLVSLIKMYSLIAMVAFVTFAGIINLATSWLVYNDKKISLKEVLTPGNVFQHFLFIVIVLVMNVALALLISLFNVVLALLILVPVAIYSINVVDCETDSYICSLVAKKEEQSDGAPTAVVDPSAPAEPGEEVKE